MTDLCDVINERFLNKKLSGRFKVWALSDKVLIYTPALCKPSANSTAMDKFR